MYSRLSNQGCLSSNRQTSENNTLNYQIKKKSSFQTNNFVNQNNGNYYSMKVNSENSKEDVLEKQKRSGESGGGGVNQNIDVSQELQTSVLSPDFLQNRRNLKKDILKMDITDDQNKQNTYDNYNNNPNTIMRTFQLVKVPICPSEELTQRQQIEDNNQNGTCILDLAKPSLSCNIPNFLNSDMSQSPQVLLNLPNSAQFYQMFFQILPEGILLLGSKQNKIHIQNRMFDRLMNFKSSQAIEKFFSLENTIANAETSELSGTYDIMPNIMNMKTILNESSQQQKMSNLNNITQLTSNNNLQYGSNQPSQFQPKQQVGSDHDERTNTQGSTNRIPSMPNVSILQSEMPQIFGQNYEENLLKNYQNQQLNQQQNQPSQQTTSVATNQIDESVLQKSTLRFSPQYIRTNSIKKQLSPSRKEKDLAEDQIIRQINNQRSQFNFDPVSKESQSQGNYYLSTTQNNIDVSYSKKRTIGEMYRSIIKEIQQDLETNGTASKYEAFEHQIKMLCSFTIQKKKRNSNSNIKSQFNISQMASSNNYNQQSTSNTKSDTSEHVENCKKIFEVTCIPCIIEGQPSALFVVRDVTHFNQIKLLKHFNKNKSQMLSQVAHELRTPLNCIISMMEMATISNISPQISSYLKPALTSAKQMNSMVNDILDLAQVKAGKFSLNMESFNLQELIQQIITLMSFQSEQKGIELISVLDPQLPQQIYSDPNRLRQIIINLVGNSLKFTKKGSITIMATVISSKIIRINIIDTGIGIKDEDKGNLFQAFGKIGGQEQKQLNPSGVGLGLMISHVLAKNLGEGEGLKVESTFGQGTEFYFEIVNSIHKMNLDKSFILKSNIVKSQYYKKSQVISQIKIDQQQQQQQQQQQIIKLQQSQQQITQKTVQTQNCSQNDELIKTFGKIESQKEMQSPTKVISKKEDDKIDSGSDKKLSSQQIQSPTKYKNQFSFTPNTLAPNPQQKSNKLVTQSSLENQDQQQGSVLIDPSQAQLSNNRLTRNTFNIIHEEEGEYEGDGSATIDPEQYYKAEEQDSPLDLEDQETNNINNERSQDKYIPKEQIGPKTKLLPCFVHKSINEYEGINSEGNLTLNKIKSNDLEFPINDDDEDYHIQQKKLSDISDLLQTTPKNYVQSKIQKCNQIHQPDSGLDLQLQNLEDLHDSSSDDQRTDEEEVDDSQQLKKQTNYSIPTSTSNHTRLKSSDQNRINESLENNSDKNFQKKRSQKRYKTKIKRSSSQVEFFESSHRSVSQSLSVSAQQEIDILTVDDNHFNNMVLKMHIERLVKAKVQQSSDGNDALLKLKEQYNKNKSGFAIIFLDLSMPEIDGYETFKMIQSFCQEKKINQYVVACTGYSDSEEKEKCYEIGMVDYIIKPIEISKLKEVLKLFLEVNIEDQ